METNFSKGLNCFVCNKFFTRPYTLRRHMQIMHNLNIAPLWKREEQKFVKKPEMTLKIPRNIISEDQNIKRADILDSAHMPFDDQRKNTYINTNNRSENMATSSWEDHKFKIRDKDIFDDEDSVEDSGEIEESSDGSNSEDSTSNSNNKIAWQTLMDDVYDKHGDEFKEKKTAYKQAGNSDEQARQKANDDLFRTYVDSLMNNYGSKLVLINDLENSPLHEKIMEAINKLTDRKKLSFPKAAKKVIWKNKRVFKTMIREDLDVTGSEDSGTQENTE